jgi:uncharacterized protein (TIGR02266 family)
MTERRVVQLLARYRVASLDEFVERHVADLGSSGMFVRTESPLAVGTFVEIDCRSEGDERLLSALGRVVRVRERSDAREGLPPGMALQFLRVDKAAERALEMGERSSRFGLRVDADDRTWSSQQRPSLGLSTLPPSPSPPPSGSVQNARIEVRVDGSMAPPATEVERTPPLFAALFGGESAALKPGRVPAGFEGLSSHGSAPDSSEVAAVTPRSAIARPFLAPRDDVPTPRMPLVEEAAKVAPHAGAAVLPFAATRRFDSVVPPPERASDALRGGPRSAAPASSEPVTAQEPLVPGADSGSAPEASPTSSTLPLARASVDDAIAAARASERASDAPVTEPPGGLGRSAARAAAARAVGVAWGPWIAAFVFLLGAAWLAQWLGDAPAPEEPAGEAAPR